MTIFHKFHPNQDSSGLIPGPWPQRDAAALNKPIWDSPEPAKPEGPSLEEKKVAALEEAINYLQDADTHENKNLACVLMLRHGISRLESDIVVQKARELITAVPRTIIDRTRTTIALVGVYDYIPVPGSSITVVSYLTGANPGKNFTNAITCACTTSLVGAISPASPVSVSICYQ